MSSVVDPPTATEAAATANDGCVGPTDQNAGKASACDGCPNQTACASGAYQVDDSNFVPSPSLSNVQHVVLVLSGKGGVGKSTLAAQLCHTLASQNYAVGLLDVDLCGPSAPRMILGDAHASRTINKTNTGAWRPVYENGVAVMSISFMLPDNDQAVVWRGPRKNALIEQFLTNVDWTGETDGLDYLVIDTPPGTSDEHISTVQILQKHAASTLGGAIVITTPEEVSLSDVRKELNFCQKTRLPMLGIVENMGTFTTSSIANLQFVDNSSNDNNSRDCTEQVLEKLRQHCPEVFKYTVSTPLFDAHNHDKNNSKSGAEQMAVAYNVPFWGRIPLDSNLTIACERGLPFVTNDNSAANNPAAKALLSFCNKLTAKLPVDMDYEE